MAKGKQTVKKDKTTIANAEYDRLVQLFTTAGVDKIKLDIFDKLIRKVATTFARLEVIEDLPTIIYNPANPTVQKETAAGKSYVKYMAQYTSCMQKLSKELLGGLQDDDGDDLKDYE